MQETSQTAQEGSHAIETGEATPKPRQMSEKSTTTPKTARKATSAAKHPALFVSAFKAIFMQRLSDMVIGGHHQYISGKIEFQKAYFLASKFESIYQTGLSRLEQSRRRGRGKAAFRWQAWYCETTGIVHWVLLKSTGQMPVEAEGEKWQDATSRNRLTAPGGYELVRITKPTEPRPVWTWRYSKNYYERLRESILGDIRGRRDVQFAQLVSQIWRTPGFAGARSQVKQIKILIQAEWKRNRGSDPLPDIPDRIGYVRRLANKGQVLKKPNPSKT